jgi:hypothetical protein
MAVQRGQRLPTESWLVKSEKSTQFFDRACGYLAIAGPKSRFNDQLGEAL